MDKTQDIQQAIALVIKPGEELTLPQLDERLYEAFPVLLDEDRRFIGAAVTRMLGDGRLTSDDPNGYFHDGYVIRRPA